jgi:hypothetical protein
MHPQKRVMALVNVVGGAAVLGSYAYGLATNPLTRGDVWGDVPDGLRPFYAASMLLATAGYFAFTYYVFFRVDADTARVARQYDVRVFNALYVAILAPSALWMPLTFEMLDDPSDGLWFVIRVVLAVVGVASIGFIVALLRLEPARPAASYWLAVGGCVAFAVQTAVLDAIVWPAYFPVV